MKSSLPISSSLTEFSSGCFSIASSLCLDVDGIEFEAVVDDDDEGVVKTEVGIGIEEDSLTVLDDTGVDVVGNCSPDPDPDGVETGTGIETGMGGGGKLAITSVY